MRVSNCATDYSFVSGDQIPEMHAAVIGHNAIGSLSLRREPKDRLRHYINEGISGNYRYLRQIRKGN